MGKPLVGEVVVLPFPQTNLEAGKCRPALVVADLPGEDLVLCQITRQPRNDGFSVPLLVTDFEHGRLGHGQFHPSATSLYRRTKRDSPCGWEIKNARLQEVRAGIRRLFA